MKRMNMKRLIDRFTFELPENPSYIYTRFRQMHERRRSIHRYWPATATRSQLIDTYWRSALLHFSSIIILGVLVTSFFSGTLDLLYFLSVAIFTIGAFPPLYYFIYRPIFNSSFLPNLENAIATYEGRELSLLEKCRQDQLSNRTLVLLFYVFDKTSCANYLSPNDKCADLLHKLFGVSTKSMKNELDLIFKKAKRAKMESRLRVEVNKSFEDAFKVLETMQFSEGIKLLKQLEQQFLRS
ncbi:hypothetical protein [Niabella drilacis]|uniref:Uncharacterized protein n=1 Tax=Niabella drilacis (strain DSM 25811 / CCM 8410 / CCUG 62505 / LMG 26954 / E90) TaxID=1285928 RepID=A0A1G6QVS5_NIADE|nr:hypothetical protein [Niabella drilacis]SDC96529.1 hypothetical protein SAMN04487894_10544 [Niabella drilacis]